MLQRYLLILLSFGLPISSMQPQKSSADMLTGAAGANNIKGLNYWIITQKTDPNIRNSWGRTPLSLAAGNGQLEATQFLLNKGAQVNSPDFLTAQDQLDKNGPTPLSWAVQFSNKTKTLEDYLDVIKLLISKGANVNHNAHGISILHNAARGGSEEIIKLILDSGAKNSINAEGAQDKGRTPLAEAIRASRDAIIHVDLENNSTATRAEFPKLLAEAITELHNKEQKKLSTDQLIKIINLFKKYGARTDMADALGNKLDYYINEVQLVSDAERAQLLQALNFKLTPRTIKYTIADLPQAIRGLENLRDVISTPATVQKISMVIWTLQEVQRTSNTQAQYDMLRVAMALLSKVKEVAKLEITDARYFADLEDATNQIRAILRDAALIVSKKTQAPVMQPKPAPTTTPTTAPQPPLKAEPKPAAVQPKPVVAPKPELLKVPEQGFLITDVINYSQDKMLIEYHNLGETQQMKLLMPAAQSAANPVKITLNRVVTLISASSPNLMQSYFWGKEKPTIIEDLQHKKELARDKYAVSKIIYSAAGTFELIPDLNINPKAKEMASTQPKPAAAQPSAVELPQKTLHVNSMYITDLLNYSEKPAKLTFHFKASGQKQEFVVNAAKNRSVPTIQEVMRAGHPDAPISIESFNQKVMLEIIPGDPTKPGKTTEVKKQIINSKEPIKYWRLSDVKQVQIVITETGEIKIVPVKKINIIDYQGK